MFEIRLTLTDKAAEEMKKNLAEEGLEYKDNPPTLGIQLRVVPGGCSGFSYTMKIVSESEADSDFIQINGVNFDVNQFSAQYLDGVTIDYVTGIMGNGFKFNNPNSSNTCGCGSSFSV